MNPTILLAIVSLGAAFVTGALGYGYSSITVPIALLVVSNTLLNPALVIVEVAVNGYSTLLNRSAIRAILPKVVPLLVGIVPGVLIGSKLLSVLPATYVKLVAYGVLLPLILVQAGGVRFPTMKDRIVGPPFGLAVGILYSLTTISGPPLALYFNNQGLAKGEFKVALAVTRVVESVLTLGAYIVLGLLTMPSLELAGWMGPGVAIGMPLGHLVIQRIAPETFRRVCMSFDAWLVGFGLSRLLADQGVPTAAAYSVLGATLVIDAILLRRFFANR